MGSFQITLFLDFEPCLRLIIITNTFSIFFQSTPTNANIDEAPNSNDTPPLQPNIDTVALSKPSPLQPGLAVFVGLLTILLCFTFLILLYAKHCRGGIGFDNANIPQPTSTVQRQHSGVDRTVIESLPLFRFKSLKGHKDGLECAVCLNKFEPTEVLRLLPKCKHAFHVECVDTWLDIHSTCPLCRYQVHPEDILLVNNNRAYNSLTRSRTGSGNLKSPPSSSSSPPPPPLPPPLPPNKGGKALTRHSSAGESGSSSRLEIIIENPSQVKRKSTTSLISSSKRSLDSTRSSFNKKLIDGVYKRTPSRLSSTGSLDTGGSSDTKRKDGLLLDTTRSNSPGSISTNQIQEHANSPGSISLNRIEEHAAKPPTPRKHRHSAGGEPSSSKTPRMNSPFSCNNKRSLDSSKSCSKQPNNTNNQSSDDRRRKDGLLLLAERRLQNDEASEQHRLKHKIIIAGADMENSGEEEVLSNVQPSDMLYLQTDEMLLSDESGRFSRLSVSKSSVMREESRSSDDRKVNDDRSVSEITGLSRFRSNEEQQRCSNANVGWTLSRWKAWISATKHHPSSPSVSISSSNAV